MASGRDDQLANLAALEQKLDAIPAAPAPPVETRDLDIIVWGATGFTGRLVCRYLTERSKTEPGLRWAIAGRNLDKLEAVRKECMAIDRTVGRDIKVLNAHLDNDKLLRGMVTRTRVVLSTAGPFTQLGEPMVRACAGSGTMYTDTAGELSWIGKMIDRYEAQAISTGSTLVPIAGYASVPSDLGALAAINYVRRVTGEMAIKRVDCFQSQKGLFTAGLFASLIDAVGDGSVFEGASPYFLCPKQWKQKRPKGSLKDADSMAVWYASSVKTWASMSIMHTVNSRVVHRSDALLNYGDDFRYGEWQQFSNPISALTNILMQFFGVALLLVPPVRWLAGKLVPAQHGPSEEVRAKNWFKTSVVAETVSGKKGIVTITGGDPGYGDTAKMIAEMAIALAYAGKDGYLERKPGFQTPASQGGMPLLKKLARNGFKIEMKMVE
eukprot:Clim_evm66s201 gene=Clim_evmTU66s201